MASESASHGTSSVASALVAGTTSPSIVASPANPKYVGLLEEAVPMVIVQQFIQDNKEKGMPLNQKVADLKRKQEEIKAERKKVTKELKDEERKRARLRAKAKQLSAEDLVQVLALRATASTAKKSKTNEANLAAEAKEKEKEEEKDE